MELLTVASTNTTHDSVVIVPNKFHSPQDVSTSEALVWIKEQKRSLTWPDH